MLDRETVTKVKVDNPARKIEFEVGDAMQDDFFPQFKTKHWDNECNFSARLVAGQGVVTEHDGKLAYDDGEQIARFYEKDTGDEDDGFEFDVVLPEKPKSNVIRWTIQHKGLDFFYQPELTPKDIEEGAERPENVVGSYAVYHKTGRNNKVGGKEYRTGKAFHIYRPYFEDAKGDRVWGVLHIDPDTNLMTVTAPDGWLDKAAYPVICDPTFGYTSVGASSLSGFNSSYTFRNGNTYSPGEDTTTDSISMYGNDGGGGHSMEMAVYTTSNTLVTNGSVSPFAISDSNSWNTASFSTGPTLASASSYYFLWAISNSSGITAYYDDTGVQYGYNTRDYNTAWTTLSSWTNSGINREFSIYATYTASGGGGGRRRIIIT